MAIALDYIGKYIIVMVAVLVAIGLILTFKGNIVDSVSSFGPDEDEKPEIVKIRKSEAQARAKKIADLIELCYKEKSGSGVKDITCYMATISSENSGSPDFDITVQEVMNKLPTSLLENTWFEDRSFDGSTITIAWDSNKRRVVVERP